MRLRVRLRVAALAWVALAVGCGNEEGVPTAELFADPEVCDPPCEVLIDSGIDAAGQSLTFTWDVGDGPFEDEERLLHRFEAAGTYEVSERSRYKRPFSFAPQAT